MPDILLLVTGEVCHSHFNSQNRITNFAGTETAETSGQRPIYFTVARVTGDECFRKRLGISCRDHITNEEVKARTGNAIGPYEDLLTSAKRRKLKWYGHVTLLSGLAKTILQGTVQGGRRRGRQRKRWEDIKEWTGLE